MSTKKFEKYRFIQFVENVVVVEDDTAIFSVGREVSADDVNKIGIDDYIVDDYETFMSEYECENQKYQAMVQEALDFISEKETK